MESGIDWILVGVSRVSPAGALAAGDSLRGLADLASFAALAVAAVFLVWAPAPAFATLSRRILGGLLGFCGVVHLGLFWFEEYSARDWTLIDRATTSLIVVFGVGLLFLLAYRRAGVIHLQETRQSLEEAQGKLTREQALLATLVENMPDAIYFKDLESCFIRCNQATADLFRLDSPEDAIGKSDYDFFSKEEADEYRGDELRIIETGAPIINKEEYELWLDGKHHWVLSTKMPLRDLDGNIIGTFGLSRDITKLKSYEAELQHRTEELERSNGELEQFAYVASHDLQEPLRTVVGFCQLLELEYQHVLDDNGQMYLDTIVEGGKRMQRLIQDLLEYSRVGRQGSPFEHVSLNLVVNEVCALLHSAIVDCDATIEVGTLPEVNIDTGQMIRVFQNLIGNALKYRGDQTPHVEIRSELAGEEWNIYVSDNGIGISREFSEQVFIIFKRLHTREEYPGTGIGLAVCRRIVERHGGRIELVYDETDVDNVQGSTFRITLPVISPTRSPALRENHGSERSM